MAANDYYYSSGGGSNNNNNNHHDNLAPNLGYPSQSPSPLSYNQNLPAYSSPSPIQRPPNADRPSHQSPFDTVFDDNAYPMNSQASSYNNPNYNPYGGSSTMSLPQQQDTAYYGPGRVTPDQMPRPHGSEDIPLQDRPHKDVESAGNDHVYDAPTAASRRKKKKKKGGIGLGQLGMFGSDKKRIPWVVYIFSIIQVAVFIGEIARNGILTKTPIQIKPYFNPMIGPSPWVLVNMGARYHPCMHNVAGVQNHTGPVKFPCPNSVTTASECELSELCGFGGVPNPKGNDPDQKPEPNQWFRFITPVFMHAGLIHIGFNLLLQLTLGKEMEMAIGSVRFILVYISSGIFGNVMGGNFAGDGLPSTGASGALFGVIALVLLDLLYSWQERRNPVKDLLFILLDIVISFVLGLLPGLDNFAHIGGFIMGLGLGICILHSPNALRRRLGQDTTYAAVRDGVNQEEPGSFFKNPMGFFKGRRPLWWVWWLVRAGCLLSVTIGFIVLLNNFYVNKAKCDWCKYLSCINVNNWCDMDTIKIVDEEPAGGTQGGGQAGEQQGAQEQVKRALVGALVQSARQYAGV